MPDIVRMRIQVGQAALAAALADVEKTLTEALEAAARVVKYKVMDLTPRWRGGLVQGIKEEVKGREARVYGEGVVMRVHETNAQWTKLPPHNAIKSWVEGKLGIAGKQADSVAWAIQQKIKKSGLTLPNVEGRGQMFKRTFDLVQSTGLHWHAFMAKMRQLENRGA